MDLNFLKNKNYISQTLPVNKKKKNKSTTEKLTSQLSKIHHNQKNYLSANINKTTYGSTVREIPKKK